MLWLDLNYGLRIWAQDTWNLISSALYSFFPRLAAKRGKSLLSGKENLRCKRGMLFWKGEWQVNACGCHCLPWTVAVGMSFAAEGLGCCQPDGEFSSHPGAGLRFLLSCVWQKKGRVLSGWFPRQPSGDEPKEARGVGAGGGAQASAQLVTLLRLSRPLEEDDGPTLALLPVCWLWDPSYRGAQTAFSKVLPTVRLAMQPRKRNFKTRFICVFRSLVISA